MQSSKRGSEYHSSPNLLISIITENNIRGRRVTALGVIFNATGLDTHASVHPAKDMATEEWVCHSPFPSYYVLIIIMRSLLT